MRVKKPLLGITMGDPAGIGPEIAVKALANKKVSRICRPLIVGDATIMEQAIKIAGVNLVVQPVNQVSQSKFKFGTIDVFDLRNVDPKKLVPGEISAMAGAAAFNSVKKVIELALEKQIDATVTGPIHKEAIHKAGFDFAGHTEMYAHFTKTNNYAMMLVEGNLRVVHVTTHVSLRKACDLVEKKRILQVIKLAQDACKKLGIKTPRIGVAGLNPHSSDGGLFGWEEENEIIPAIKKARSIGINVEGPIPGDTLFSKAYGGHYDITVAMYHDQGHIPLKLKGFIWSEQNEKWESISGINITLGLPIIRTSVDHGTAFDQAGKGTASEISLINAIEYAAMMARNH
jgi:4-hydroxythreonine-4-phosphate dehydrogenase